MSSVGPITPTPPPTNHSSAPQRASQLPSPAPDSYESAEPFTLTGCCFIDILLKPFYCLLIRIGFISPKEDEPKPLTPTYPPAPPIIPTPPPRTSLPNQSDDGNRNSDSPSSTPPNSSEPPPSHPTRVPRSTSSTFSVNQVMTPQPNLPPQSSSTVRSASGSMLTSSPSMYMMSLENACYSLSIENVKKVLKSNSRAELSSEEKVDLELMNSNSQHKTLQGCSDKILSDPASRERNIYRAKKILNLLFGEGADLNAGYVARDSAMSQPGSTQDQRCVKTSSGIFLAECPALLALRLGLDELFEFYLEQGIETTFLKNLHFKRQTELNEWLWRLIKEQKDEIFSKLIKLEISLDFSHEGLTPLQVACCFGLKKSLEELLQRAVDIAQTGAMNSALGNVHWLRKKPLEILEERFESFKDAPPESSAEVETYMEMLDCLLLHIINTCKSLSDQIRGSSALHFACYYALERSAEKLINADNVNEEGNVTLQSGNSAFEKNCFPLKIIQERSEHFPDISGKFDSITELIKQNEGRLSPMSPPPRRKKK